ncbi:MAG TPA: DnaJ domain-containing protein [Acetobacteraceae bacterium]|nr:DnaJ domain-containing protein [Acetobacteraceae bacterium]
MLWLALGGLTLFAFLGGLRAFERASVNSVKLLLAWIAALAGLSLALMLVLTGRAGGAIAAATLLVPLAWEKWRAVSAAAGHARASAGAHRPPPRSGTMSRAEAYAVLGLRPGASEAAIRAAHKRLMRAVHPDGGGSDWVAARVNQARDVLLGQARRRA